MTLTSFGHDENWPEAEPEQGLYQLALARRRTMYSAFMPGDVAAAA
jgi:hypothetical protein